MTDTIDFLIDTTQGASRPGRSLRFRVLDTLAQLPEGPGLFVLMGARPEGGSRPLAFGFVPGNLARHLPGRPEFAAALREGFGFVAIADPLPGRDATRTAEALGQAHLAPINIRQDALREIDNAKLPAPRPMATAAPLAAE